MGQLGAGRLDATRAEHTNLDVSDADGKKIDGYNTVDFGSYALPVGKVSFSVENLLDKDYTTAGASAHRGCIAQPTAHRVFILIKAVDVRLV